MSDEAAYAAIETSDGHYLIAGLTETYGAGYSDAYIIKTDTSGNPVWTQILGNIFYDEVYSAIETSDSSYLLAGWSYSLNMQDEMYLVKLSSLGDTLWTRTIPGAGSGTRANALIETSDGNYLVAGATPGFLGYHVLYLAKVSPVGETLWIRAYEPVGVDIFSVLETEAGPYLAAGMISPGGMAPLDMYLICLEGIPSPVFPPATATLHKFQLYPPHPNPFNPSTTVSFELRAASFVSLRVYDTAGRLVTTLVNGWREAGLHQVTFAGSDLTTGVYLYRLTAGEYQASGKLVLLK